MVWKQSLTQLCLFLIQRELPSFVFLIQRELPSFVFLIQSYPALCFWYRESYPDMCVSNTELPSFVCFWYRESYPALLFLLPGFLYDHGHLSRAVCCRLARGPSFLDEALPPGFQLKHPWLGRVTACQPLRETQKTKAFSINWTHGDQKAEVLDGTLGHCYTASVFLSFSFTVRTVLAVGLFFTWTHLCYLQEWKLPSHW